MVALENELQAGGLLDDRRAEQNFVKVPPSAGQVELMEEAIRWIAVYLSGKNYEDERIFLAGWIDHLCRGKYTKRDRPSLAYRGLELMAVGLIRDRVRVR